MRGQLFIWIFVAIVAMWLSFVHSYLMPSADELGFVVDGFHGNPRSALYVFLIGGVGLALAWIYGRYTRRRGKVSFVLIGMPIVGIVWYFVGVPIYFLTVGGGVLSIRNQYYYALQGLNVFGILTLLACGVVFAFLGLMIAWPSSLNPDEELSLESQ